MSDPSMCVQSVCVCVRACLCHHDWCSVSQTVVPAGAHDQIIVCVLNSTLWCGYVTIYVRVTCFLLVYADFSTKCVCETLGCYYVSHFE